MQRTVSSAGLVLLLICMPFGVIRILLWALTSSVALPSTPGATSAFGGTTEAVDRLYQAKNNTCWSYISKVNLPFSPAPTLYDPISQKYFPYKDLIPSVTSEPQFLDADFTQLAYLEDVYFQSCNTMDELKRPSGGHRSVCSFFVLTLLVVLLIVGTAYTTANIFVLLFGLVFGYNKALNLSPTSSISYDITIGRESASKFGWVGAILQILLVTYVTCTSLFGLYALPISQRHLLPRPHGTPMAKLLANVICILLMSSALPLQTSLLGLAEPSFPYHYSINFGGSFCQPSNEAWDPSAPVCTQSSTVATTSQAFAVIAPAGSPQCASPSYNLATEASSLPSTSIVDPVAANTRELFQQQQQQYSPQASPEDGLQTGSSPATGPTPVYTPNTALAVAQQHLRTTSPDSSEEGRVMAASLGNLSLTAMLTFVYLGLDPKSYSLLMALFYNIGFLATCYWLFRQHVHTLTQLLPSQVYYKFAVRFLPRFMYLERRSPASLVVGHHRHHE
ncbi:Limb region 1 -like protein [Sparganum proliferum]